MPPRRSGISPLRRSRGSASSSRTPKPGPRPTAASEGSPALPRSPSLPSFLSPLGLSFPPQLQPDRDLVERQEFPHLLLEVAHVVACERADVVHEDDEPRRMRPLLR